MGLLKVDIEVGTPGRRPRWRRFEKVLVDNGSEISWFPAEDLIALAIPVLKRDQSFVTADGRNIRRDVGFALLRCGKFKTVDEVVFAQRGDLCLLGARTLEGFNALIDPRARRLVAGGPMPAARVCTLLGPTPASGSIPSPHGGSIENAVFV